MVQCIRIQASISHAYYEFTSLIMYSFTNAVRSPFGTFHRAAFVSKNSSIVRPSLREGCIFKEKEEDPLLTLPLGVEAVEGA